MQVEQRLEAEGAAACRYSRQAWWGDVKRVEAGGRRLPAFPSPPPCTVSTLRLLLLLHDPHRLRLLQLTPPLPLCPLWFLIPLSASTCTMIVTRREEGGGRRPQAASLAVVVLAAHPPPPSSRMSMHVFTLFLLLSVTRRGVARAPAYPPLQMKRASGKARGGEGRGGADGAKWEATRPRLMYVVHDVFVSPSSYLSPPPLLRLLLSSTCVVEPCLMCDTLTFPPPSLHHPCSPCSATVLVDVIPAPPVLTSSLLALRWTERLQY